MKTIITIALIVEAICVLTAMIWIVKELIRRKKDKLEKLKAAAAEIKDPKKKEQVKDNVTDLKVAIDDLKKRKESLGESFVSFENEIWSINILLEKLSSRIDDYLIN